MAEATASFAPNSALPWGGCSCAARSRPGICQLDTRHLVLTDRDGDWWIRPHPDGDGIDKVPPFDERQFVETNAPGQVMATDVHA